MDGATSMVHDTIAKIRDSVPPPAVDPSSDEAVIEALALFIERSGLGSQAKCFLYQYFDGLVPQRTP